LQAQEAGAGGFATLGNIAGGQSNAQSQIALQQQQLSNEQLAGLFQVGGALAGGISGLVAANDTNTATNLFNQLSQPGSTTGAPI
jgi:hypothetical protein